MNTVIKTPSIVFAASLEKPPTALPTMMPGSDDSHKTHALLRDGSGYFHLVLLVVLAFCGA